MSSAQPRSVSWSTDLFDCFDDDTGCCLTLWCPCIAYGMISEIVDEGSSSCGCNAILYTLVTYVTGSPAFITCFNRAKLKEKCNIDDGDDCCDDFLIHSFCGPCALCQEYRELQNQGFDVSLGWDGNMEKRCGGAVRPPVVHGNMEKHSSAVELDPVVHGSLVQRSASFP